MRKFSFQLSTPVSRRPWGLLMTYHPTINHLQLLAFSRSARLIGCCHLVWNAGLWVLGRSLSSAVFNWWLIRLKGSLFLISKLGSWLSKIRRYYKDNMKNGWVRPFIRRGLFPRFSWTRMTLNHAGWDRCMYCPFLKGISIIGIFMTTYLAWLKLISWDSPVWVIFILYIICVWTS